MVFVNYNSPAIAEQRESKASWVFSVASLTVNALGTAAFNLSHQDRVQERVENHVSKVNCRREEGEGEVLLDHLNAVSYDVAMTLLLWRLYL